MSIDRNARLIYGFVRNDEFENLFSAIVTAWENSDTEEDCASLEEMHEDLQEKHGITLKSIGYSGLDILYTYSERCSGEGMQIKSLMAESLAKTAEYGQSIKAFLQALDIPADTYTPGWYLISYTD